MLIQKTLRLRRESVECMGQDLFSRVVSIVQKRGVRNWVSARDRVVTHCIIGRRNYNDLNSKCSM